MCESRAHPNPTRRTLDLSRNNFTTQSLPTLLPSPKLENLMLSHNNFAAGLGALPGGVKTLALAGCRLNAVPPALFVLDKLVELDLSGGGLQGELPEELGAGGLVGLVCDGNMLVGVRVGVGGESDRAKRGSGTN
jgi:Leucine-rich repeat (LRR) protein